MPARTLAIVRELASFAVTMSSIRRASLDRAQRVLVALLVLVSACSLLLVASFGYGRDQGIYALVARTVLNDGMPYRDAFDFKPPGIYLLYAATRGLFGSGWWAIRLVEFCGAAGTIAALALLSKRWWNEWRIGLLGGCIYALVHAQLDFWHTAQPETFGGMLVVFALVIGASHPSQHVRRSCAGTVATNRLFIAGILFGCAGLLKPPLAGGGAVLALWHTLALVKQAHGGEKRWRSVATPLLSVLAGGTTPFVLCLAWFWSRGALDALHQTLFVFTPHYTALSWEGRSPQGMLYQAFAQWLVSFSSTTTFGLLLGLAGWQRIFATRHTTGLVFGVIGIQLVGVALQGKFFPYHYAACWPLTGLVAALAYWHWWQRALQRGWFATGVFALLVVVGATMRTATKDLADSFWRRSAKRVNAFLLRNDTEQKAAELASVADVSAASNQLVADELKRRVPRDGYVYIWGFEPVIYDLAERRFASPYIYNVPQRVQWAAPAARATLLEDLQEHPPVAIVVAHHDVFPMVTGSTFDSASVMRESFPGLDELVANDYAKVKRLQDFDIYVRRHD